MQHPEDIPLVALLLAAGESSRLGGQVAKPYLSLKGRTVLEWSALRLSRLPGHRGTVLAVDAAALAQRLPRLRPVLDGLGVVRTIEGGRSRQDSCARAYLTAADIVRGFDIVVVHDCARPFFSLEATRRAIAAAAEIGGAIVGHYARDTLKRVDGAGMIRATLPRSEIFQAATPQVFRADRFRAMVEYARTHGVQATDEAGLAEAAGIPVRAIAGVATNIKLTYPEDLALLPALERLLEEE